MRACSANTATHMSVRAGFDGREDIQVSDNEITRTIPFGMFELDAAGTVVHYSAASEEKKETLANSILGRNFFDELISISQVEELKSRFLKFMANGTSVERFTISFPYNQETIKVQVVMAHLSEKTEKGRERFALIRLMPEAYATASSFAEA
jgi:photoactive yellow protein